MAAGLAVVLTACGSSEKKTAEGENPFFTEYTTPFGVPPFDQIKFEHYKPAMLKGMEEGRKEIEAIAPAVYCPIPGSFCSFSAVSGNPPARYSITGRPSTSMKNRWWWMG